jgi:hypothetical protein
MQMERIEQAVQRTASLRGARAVAGSAAGAGAGEACRVLSEGDVTE